MRRKDKLQRHIFCTRDLTEVQDEFCKIVAREGAKPHRKLIKLYRELPQVTANEQTASSYIRTLLTDPRVQRKIAAYRKVFNSDKSHILADREYVTQQILEKWEQGGVTDRDILMALSGREKAHGIGLPSSNDTKSIYANAEQEKEALEAAYTIVGEQDAGGT